MNAVERATEMMVVKMRDLPPLAVKHAKYMCDKYGMCCEIFVTAYANYAQIVEGLETEDELYKLNPLTHKEIIEWFKEEI